MNLWLEAVKEWNATKNKGTYKIPKKDTAEYKQVKAIMSKLEKKHKKKDVKGGGILGFFNKPTRLEKLRSNLRGILDRQKKHPDDEKTKQLVEYYQMLIEKEKAKSK